MKIFLELRTKILWSTLQDKSGKLSPSEFYNVSKRLEKALYKKNEKSVLGTTASTTTWTSTQKTSREVHPIPIPSNLAENI